MRAEIVSFSASGDDGIAVAIRLCEYDNVQNCRFVIPSSLYVKLGLSKGECSTELFDTLEHESKVYEAYRRGICVLGFGACSKKMLVSKLIEGNPELLAELDSKIRSMKDTLPDTTEEFELDEDDDDEFDIRTLDDEL